MNKVVVAVRELHLATTLVLCFSNGSVEFRSRSTLDLLPRDDADRVSSMAQVGLELLPGAPCECHPMESSTRLFLISGSFASGLVTKCMRPRNAGRQKHRRVEGNADA